MAKPESFFCHDPRSISPDPERFTAGVGAETAGADGTDGAETVGADGTDTGSSFSGLSSAFFFEAVGTATEVQQELHVQYQ